MKRIEALYSLLILIVVGLVGYLGYMSFAQTGAGMKTSMEQAYVNLDSKKIPVRIYNNEDRGMNYTYYLIVDDTPSHPRTVYIPGNQSFILTLSESFLNESKRVTVLVYREGELEPIENTTHYIGKSS